MSPTREDPLRHTARYACLVAADGVRERLLAAAVGLFAEKGYEAASVQDVVEAAGVTKGAFYYYFRSKDDVLHEIYKGLLDLQLERLEAYVTASGPADERLHDAAVDVVLTSHEHNDAFAVFVRSMNQLDDEHARAVRRERRRYHDRFRELVEQGQRARVFRADVDADVAVHSFLGAAHAIPSWFRPRGPLSIDEVAEQMVSLLLDGLRGQRVASRTRSQRPSR